MVEQVVDLIFVEMLGKVAGFDSVLGLVAIDWFEKFDWTRLRIMVECGWRVLLILSIGSIRILPSLILRQ